MSAVHQSFLQKYLPKTFGSLSFVHTGTCFLYYIVDLAMDRKQVPVFVHDGNI